MFLCVSIFICIYMYVCIYKTIYIYMYKYECSSSLIRKIFIYSIYTFQLNLNIKFNSTVQFNSTIKSNAEVPRLAVRSRAAEQRSLRRSAPLRSDNRRIELHIHDRIIQKYTYIFMRIDFYMHIYIYICTYEIINICTSTSVHLVKSNKY